MTKMLVISRLSGRSRIDDCPDSIEVPITTLDSFHLPVVDLIKIDVEGYEKFVIDGGTETIYQHRPVMIVEQKEKLGGSYGLEPKSALRLLESMGAKIRQEIVGDFILTFD